MRVLIVDDEPAARRRLALMLEELDVELAGEAENGVEALEMVERLQPDVLLLDIQMREVSGIDVARHIGAPRPVIIFQTAHDHYAVQAFEESALDYLLKPVSLDRLRVALERARDRIQSTVVGEPGLDTVLLQRLEKALGSARPGGHPRILVRDTKGHRLLNVREILRFGAVDGVVAAFAVAGRFATDFTLDELERRHSPAFARVSRSDLVNIDAIRQLSAEGDGGALLTLADKSTVRVSRRRAAEVRRVLNM